jgi:hypothetical protein
VAGAMDRVLRLQTSVSALLSRLVLLLAYSVRSAQHLNLLKPSGNLTYHQV